ncbi:contact-dependent growth inhibition system immunity protein [Paraherbaspirillum soli]|uniref:Contact-dependent growth inhibition system immunity protein n=1 Tax=Paraherbaspirillum soli TaxID=631222 RepID=A0ABW0MFZ0_9BURK
MNQKFLTLKNFFGAYLNQDFDLEFGAADDAINAFIHQADENERLLAASEIEQLIATTLDEEQLRTFIFNELGCCYFYPSEWDGGIAWLKHIRSLLLK